MNLAPYVEDFGPYTVGDAPLGTFEFDLVDPDTQQVQYVPDALLSVYLDAPSGLSWEVPLILPDVDSDAMEGDPYAAEWPTWVDGAALSEPGVWTLRVRVNGQTVRPFRFVVQPIHGWHTLDTARDEWADAKSLSDVVLWKLLEASRVQCEAFAPPVVFSVPPLTYVQAQLMQARALSRAMVAQSGDQLGDGEFAVTVYPLDHTIRALLRPKRGAPGRM